jgi:hypothetical protein
MDRDAVEREAEKLMPDLAAVARQPARWRALSDEQLERLLLRQCVLYDLFPDDRRRSDDLTQLYALAVDRLPLETRGRVLDAVAERCAQLAHPPNGLLPFLYRDPEPSIVAAAALHSAVLFPRDDDDPLTGPKTIRHVADEAADDAVRGAMLAGLVLLGDRRVMPLLAGCWERLGHAGVDALTQARSGIVHAAHVGFLLDALEAQPEAHWGAWAAALIQLRTTARVPKVVDVERALPVWSGGGPPVRVLRDWTFDAFAALIAPRLRALAARETSDPRVIPAVLEAWDVAPA